jgi:succinate dehydrogenase / fumarate reductase cytochrome b subunit
MSNAAPSAPGKPRATEGPASRPGSELKALGRGAWMREVWASTIGKKVIVAITGAILAGYVVLHVLGNLKALQGAGGDPALDKYAEWLRTVGEPAIPREGLLWVIRVVLLVALILHVTGIVQLVARNQAARPPGHRQAKRLGRSVAATAMLATGLLLLAFVVFHILQFTTGTIEVTPIREGDVYANLYDAFQKWYFVLIYVAASLLIAMHLYHGLWSAIQTAGWDKPNRNASFRRLATGTALFAAIGFALIPVLFFVDVLPEPSV